ncbi:hypothetical protein JL722_958 [Aureococcus anophagefferens]|nr:hypothetical protein JL722_958 [Aureococcus anophagefferens]
MMTSGSHETAVQLDALHKAQIYYTKKIENERLRLHQVEKKLDRMRKTILEFKKQVGGEWKRREVSIRTQRESVRLESALQTVKEKHDRLQHKIKTLAVEINNKRREKIQHERVTAKAEKSLARAAAAIGEPEPRALQETEEEREQAGRQCEALKGEIIDEMEQFNDRVSSTHNSIVAATGQCGLSSAASAGAAPSSKGGAKGGGSGGGKDRAFLTQERSKQPEVDLQQEVNKAYWVVAKTRMDLTKQIERKEELHSAFDKICSETKTHVDPSADPALKGKHPLEGLVPLLLKSEEENYLVFRTINELNQELETLELEKVSLEDDMEQRALANEDRLHQEENMKKELGAQLATSEATEKTHEDQHRANEQSLISASEAVTTIFHKLGCGEIPSGEALVATGLTERNVEQFLGLIEDQLVEPQLDASLSAPFDDATDESPDDAAFAAPIDPSKLLNSLKSGAVDDGKGRNDTAKGHVFNSRIVSLRPKSQVVAVGPQR